MRSRTSALLSVLSGAVLLASVHAAEAQNRNVTVVLQEEPFSVEPCNANTSIIGKVLKQSVVETLVEVDPADGSIRPRLATSWQPLDSLTWRFKLRDGVTFHDGSAFNADAVIYAVNRTLDTAIDCEVRIKVFGGFKMTLKAVDSHTLDITTDKPQPILPTMFAPLTIMSPKTRMGEVATHPVGTGPYEFVDWKHGQEINLKRFAGYWGTQPQVEAAKYVWRNELSVRASMVEVGEADLAPNISQQDAGKPELDVSYPNSETVRLRIDVTKEPLTDRRVREAMNLAIDRAALVGSVFSRDVQHATQLVLPSINGHNGDIPVWPYDPERAKSLLKAAQDDGIPVDSEIEIIGRIGVYPNSAELMETVMAMLRAVGLNVSLKMMEVAEHVRFLQKPWPAVGPNIQQDQHDNNNGDAVFTVFYKYGSGGANSKLTDPRLDRVIERASGAVGYERRRLWQEAFEIINLDIIADIPLFHMVGYARVGKRINFSPNITTNTQVDLDKITFN